MDDPAGITFRGADPPAQIIVEATARLRIVELLRVGAGDTFTVCFIPQNQNAGLRIVHETPVRDLQNVYDFPLGINDHQRFFDLSFRASCHNTVFFVFSVKLSFFPSAGSVCRRNRFGVLRMQQQAVRKNCHTAVFPANYAFAERKNLPGMHFKPPY